MSIRPALAFLVLLALPSTGLAASKARQAAETSAKAGAVILGVAIPNDFEVPSLSGFTSEDIDMNGDGNPEIVNFYRNDGSHTLAIKELDLNMDGTIDVASFFDSSGRLVKEEFDGDFDGKFDWVDLYVNGVRVTAEIDTNFDGKPDVLKTYDASGKVVRLQRDLDFDGHVDPEPLSSVGGS
jgi:hypothetical protein